MDSIPKITRESLMVGVYDRLKSNFRCFRLDSYTDMTFEGERQLSRILGTRCRWPAPHIFRNKKEELEYTFLLSTNFNTKKETNRAQRHVYLIWKGVIEQKGLLYKVEATDFNLDSQPDKLKIESEISEPMEYEFQKKIGFQLPDDLNGLLPSIEEAYLKALATSGITPQRPSAEPRAARLPARSAEYGGFRKAPDRKGPITVGIRSR